MLRFYFGLDYGDLTDSEFINYVHELVYVIDFEGKRNTAHGNIQMPNL